MMDWVYMAPELPGQDLFTGSGQDRIGFAMGDDYVVDPGAVKALQVSNTLTYTFRKRQLTIVKTGVFHQEVASNQIQ